jgi:hypothetical protein
MNSNAPKSDSTQSSNQTQNTQSNTQSNNQTSTTQPTDSISAQQSNTQQSTEALPRKPASTREALAKVGWSNEYGGSHTFLVTMYDCDNEGAYFCFLIGKK